VKYKPLRYYNEIVGVCKPVGVFTKIRFIGCFAYAIMNLRYELPVEINNLYYLPMC